LKVTYTEDAIADIVDAISYLNERNPTAAANLDAEIAQCIDRLVAQEFDGPVSRLRSGISCDVGPSRRFASTTSASPTSCWSFASNERAYWPRSASSRTRAAGDGATDRVHEIRFWNKLDALDAPAKHLGILKDQMEVTGDGGAYCPAGCGPSAQRGAQEAGMAGPAPPWQASVHRCARIRPPLVSTDPVRPPALALPCLLDVSQLVHRLNVSPEYGCGLCRAGKLRAVKITVDREPSRSSRISKRS
jgi:plasmid stabilization system protein ParE